MTTPAPDPELQQALEQAQQADKKLRRIIWVSAFLFALFIAAFAANHNVYSLLFTFVVAFASLIMAGVYRVPMLVLYVATLIYCVLDNYLSHQGSYDQTSFLIQFAALLTFTTIMSQSTPHLIRALKSDDTK